MMIDAQYHQATTRELRDAEDRSIGTAMRATLWFVAIVLLLLWAGIADAAWSDASPVPAVAARSG